MPTFAWVFDWLSPQGVIAGGVIIGLVQQFLAKRAAMAAAHSAEHAAKLAAVAATDAAEHSLTAVRAVISMAGDIKEVATNTNSIMAAALAAKDEIATVGAQLASAVGEKRGIEIGIAQEVARKESST